MTAHELFPSFTTSKLYQPVSNMAYPSPSCGLNLEETEDFLQDSLNKNFGICDSGSELDSDEDGASVVVENPSHSEESEADIASDAEDESVSNLQLKRPRL
jgi:hypothetical protein